MSFKSLRTTITALLATLSISHTAMAQTQVVTVYTYNSFTAEWGAGPKVKALFEKAYPQCEVNYVSLDNGGTLFNRVRLEGKKTKADIVLGLDNFIVEEARKSQLFTEHGVALERLDLLEKWQDTVFLPYDFGTYAFIYDKNKVKNPPSSLKELVERQDLRVIYQDPRTSSVGRGLLVWINAVYPEDQVAQAWKTLSKHTVTVGKGWSDTYGAFLKGEADMVLSYSSSPLYHQWAEQKDNYVATRFSEGNLKQVELAARVLDRPNACADHFMGYLVSTEAQRDIAMANIMLPVIAEPVEPQVDTLKNALAQQTVLNHNASAEQIKRWVSVWQTALSQ